ncbi:homocysteine S-methyltransferase family protein [Streptomyces thinghirensis]|nr:homocysteine S-methyltransferase family protein [Streptomyces thinghirensis]
MAEAEEGDRGGRELLRPRGCGGRGRDRGLGSPASRSSSIPTAGGVGRPGAGVAGSSSFAPERVGDWRAAGARLVGGCCRVGPDTITSIASALSSP